MLYIIVGHERFALPIGESLVGGTGDDSLPFAELATLPVMAAFQVMPDGTATAERRGDHAVLVNGRTLDAVPVRLAHGTRIQVSSVHLLFGDVRAMGSTTHVAGVSDEDLALLAAMAPTIPTADTGGRIITAEGRVYQVPDAGLEIGRDPACGLALASKEVSRLHARVAPRLLGYVITDLGANGVYVNGTRVDGSQLLSQGDVILIGGEELRFGADVASFEPSPLTFDESSHRFLASVAQPSSAAGAQCVSRLAGATLRILDPESLEGIEYCIDQEVIGIGRGTHNHVMLTADSVSGSHATLEWREDGWWISDCDSTNGTYVNGERITGAQRLNVDGSSDVSFGGVEAVFQPLPRTPKEDASTRLVVGMTSENLRKLREAGDSPRRK